MAMNTLPAPVRPANPGTTGLSKTTTSVDPGTWDAQVARMATAKAAFDAETDEDRWDGLCDVFVGEQDALIAMRPPTLAALAQKVSLIRETYEFCRVKIDVIKAIEADAVELASSLPDVPAPSQNNHLEHATAWPISPAVPAADRTAWQAAIQLFERTTAENQEAFYAIGKAFIACVATDGDEASQRAADEADHRQEETCDRQVEAIRALIALPAPDLEALLINIQIACDTGMVTNLDLASTIADQLRRFSGYANQEA